jgi:large subunit ribosomal protein L31e
VPLTQAWITARHKRTKRAVKVLKEFAEHHMKSSEIKITTDLNERLWNRGITKPPRKIQVRMVKDEDGVITISLPKVEKPAELSDEEKAKQAALPAMKEKSLPETKEAALPAAQEEKKEEPAPAPAKAPAKKKAAAKKPAAKKKTEKKSD